jgi:predicted SnoaL-like aldol condensation-catalyzing enzyme
VFDNSAHERPDGVHLSYDRMASFLAAYKNAAALNVARELDEKVEALQPVSWIAADILRINDGILVEHWDVIQNGASRPDRVSMKTLIHGGQNL